MNEKTETLANTDAQEDAPAKDSWGGFLTLILCVVLLSLAFRSFAFSMFNIPSESMLPRLMNGDYLVASKWNYGYTSKSLPFDLPLIPGRWFAAEPERGDVVIFKHPVDGTDYVKRVIGLPGDLVEMQGGQVVLNGNPVPKAAIDDIVIPVSANTRCAWGAQQEALSDGRLQCRYSAFRETLPGGKSYRVLDFGLSPKDNWGPAIVPDGTMFLLGDNRDNSQDSRFTPEPAGGVGFVPQSLLVGKAQRIVWSTDGGAEWLKPWTWFSAARSERMWDAI
ncbi:signal peptidase I [Parerythrobacter jejuensis]|uniref:Signal peptidase I n=1 Tax=Parerythrobacter jejuensis TaxID=795812 RepID=A0A845ARK5_9SPHN|nr:signal peptidase I [Parerythrobacter jejuensis]MXP32119.1 signal peptidase I [Parerythrobacter jejuensis]